MNVKQLIEDESQDAITMARTGDLKRTARILYKLAYLVWMEAMEHDEVSMERVIPDDTPLNEMKAWGMSNMTYVPLSGAFGSTATIRSVLDQTDSELLRCPNFGRKKLTELRTIGKRVKR